MKQQGTVVPVPVTRGHRDLKIGRGGTQVLNSHDARTRIRHDPLAGHPAVFIHGARPHPKAMQAVGGGKEIAERTPHGLLAVKRGRPDKRPETCGLGSRYAKSEPADRSRSGRQIQDERFARRQGLLLLDRRLVFRSAGLQPLAGRGRVSQLIPRERTNAHMLRVGAIVDDVIERFGGGGDSATAGKWYREEEDAGPSGFPGQRRFGPVHPAGEQGDHVLVDHGLCVPVQVNPEVRSHPIVEAVIEIGRPHAGDAARAVVFHQHPLVAPVVGLRADEPESVLIRKPAGLVPGNRGPVVAAGLQRAVLPFRPPGHHRPVRHLVQQRGQGDRRLALLRPDRRHNDHRHRDSPDTYCGRYSLHSPPPREKIILSGTPQRIQGDSG